jgi:hypothetical protein
VEGKVTTLLDRTELMGMDMSMDMVMDTTLGQNIHRLVPNKALVIPNMTTLTKINISNINSNYCYNNNNSNNNNNSSSSSSNSNNNHKAATRRRVNTPIRPNLDKQVIPGKCNIRLPAVLPDMQTANNSIRRANINPSRHSHIHNSNSNHS